MKKRIIKKIKFRRDKNITKDTHNVMCCALNIKRLLAKVDQKITLDQALHVAKDWKEKNPLAYNSNVEQWKITNY